MSTALKLTAGFLERTTDLPTSTNITVTGWWYTASSSQTFWSLWDGGDNYLSFGIDFSGGSRKAYVYLEDSIDFYDDTGSTALSANTWYFFAYIKTGSDHKLYVSTDTDPVVLVEECSITQAITIYPATEMQLLAGSGRIANVKIWTQALTTTEIEDEANVYAVTEPTDLHLQTPLESGSDLADDSGNGRDWDGSGASGLSSDTGPTNLSGGGGGTAPDAPTNLAGDVSEYGTVALTWDDNASDEDGFDLEYCTGSGCTSWATQAIGASPGTGSTGVNLSISAGEIKRYRVRAQNIFGDSDYSNIIEVTGKPYKAVNFPASGGNYLLGSDSSGLRPVRYGWGNSVVVAWVRPKSLGTFTIGYWCENYTYKYGEDVGLPKAETWDIDDTEVSSVWFGVIDGVLTARIRDGRSAGRGAPQGPGPVFDPSIDPVEHGELRQTVTITGPTLELDEWQRVALSWESLLSFSGLHYDTGGSKIKLWLNCGIVAIEDWDTTAMNGHAGDGPDHTGDGHVGFGAITQGHTSGGQREDLFVGGLPFEFTGFATTAEFDLYDFKQFSGSLDHTAVGEGECACDGGQPQLWWKLRDVDDLVDYGSRIYGGITAPFGTFDATLTGSVTEIDEGDPANPCNYGFSVPEPPPPFPPSITKSHDGSFTRGQNDASYEITVTNDTGQDWEATEIVVTEVLPDGLELVSMSGDGWDCVGNVCTRSDELLNGDSFPVITVVVEVAIDALDEVTNLVTLTTVDYSIEEEDTTLIVDTPVVPARTPVRWGLHRFVIKTRIEERG